MKNNDKKIDDIVAMLDNLASTNVGHINIEVNKNGDIDSKEISQANSLDCSSGNMACKVPTLFEGIENN